MLRGMRASAVLLLVFAGLAPALLACGVRAAAAVRPGGLRLQTVLEKTVFRVDAAEAVVDLPPATATQVSALRRGRSCDAAVRADLERALLASDAADIELTFRHGASLDQFLASYRANWKRMIGAGMLARDFDVERETRRQRARFSFLEKSGFREGDRFLYRLRGDTVAMRFVDVRNVERLDETEVGAFPRRSLLAAFFLEGAEFRDGLLRSACR
jgi:hypothetical protein